MQGDVLGVLHQRSLRAPAVASAPVEAGSHVLQVVLALLEEDARSSCSIELGSVDQRVAGTFALGTDDVVLRHVETGLLNREREAVGSLALLVAHADDAVDGFAVSGVLVDDQSQAACGAGARAVVELHGVDTRHVVVHSQVVAAACGGTVAGVGTRNLAIRASHVAD